MKSLVFRSAVSKLYPKIGETRIISAGMHFIDNIISAKVFNSYSKKGPLFVTWLPTFRCNAGCDFCFTNRMKCLKDGLSREQAIKTAREIAMLKPVSVGFTGGEVFLWPYLFDAIRELKKKGIVVYVVTNGLLLKRFSRKLVDYGVDYVIVSIDHKSSEIHNQLRKTPGTFEKAIEGIDYLKSIRKRFGKHGTPLIKTTTVVSKMNLSDLSNIIDFLRKKADVVSIQPIFSGFASFLGEYSSAAKSKLLFAKPEESSARKAFSLFLKKHPQFDTPYFRGFPDYWFNPDKLIKSVCCWSPFLRLQILPTGDVTHCTLNPRLASIGNVKEKGILKIWNSREMKQQREIIRQNKNKCVCWTQDSSFNSYLDSFWLLRKLPKFKLKKINRINLR